MRRLGLLLSLLCASLSLGCLRYAAKPMPALRAAEAPAKIRDGDVACGARPYLFPYVTTGAAYEQFGVDLPARDYLVVLLVLENDGEQEVVLDRSRVQLQLQQGQPLEVLAPEVVAATLRYPSSSMMPASRPSIATDSTEYDRDLLLDFVEKGLPAQLVLRPKQHASRFLFFHTTATDLRGARLQVAASVGDHRRDLSLTF